MEGKEKNKEYGSRRKRPTRIGSRRDSASNREDGATRAYFNLRKTKQNEHADADNADGIDFHDDAACELYEQRADKESLQEAME